MKKFFYVFLSCAMLSMLPACGPDEPTPDPDEDTPEYLDKTKESQMVINLGLIPIKGDTTITVNNAVYDQIRGTMQMEVRGSIKGVSGFRVTATRSEKGQKDELCAGVQCVPGDGELTQDFDYNLVGGATEAIWYAHYTPVKEGVYTVAYKFQNYNRTITLTVKYNYQGAE